MITRRTAACQYVQQCYMLLFHKIQKTRMHTPHVLYVVFVQKLCKKVTLQLHQLQPCVSCIRRQLIVITWLEIILGVIRFSPVADGWRTSRLRSVIPSTVSSHFPKSLWSLLLSKPHDSLTLLWSLLFLYGGVSQITF